MTEEPRPVASGTFRIDRRRALEKLREFQLQDPGDFVLPWLRCAVASQATRISLSAHSSKLSLAFDGRPLDEACLQDPYGALFSDAPDAPRRRDLALGLLSAFRLCPEEVTLVSGKAPQRLRLTALSIDSDALSAESGPASGTQLAVRWGLLRFGAAQELAARAVQACALLPVPLELNDRPVASEDRGEPCVEACRDGVRIRLRPPADPFASQGRVTLHKLGVRVCSMDWSFPTKAVDADINDDAFALDASQSSVAHDERLDRALGLADEQVHRLIEVAAQTQHRYPQLAAFLFEPGGDAYRRRLERIRGFRLPFSEWGKAGPLDTLLLWEARVTHWLRSASRLLRTYESDRKHAHLKALWEAPLYLSVTGKGLSPLALDEQRARRGIVPIATRAPECGTPLDVVWLPTGEDARLEALFPRHVANVDGLLASLARAPGSE